MHFKIDFVFIVLKQQVGFFPLDNQEAKVVCSSFKWHCVIEEHSIIIL